MVVENLSDLKPGQKVRVTYEGVVSDESGWGWSDQRLGAVKSSSNTYYLYRDMEALKVELLEPEYAHGVAYLDANGDYWLYDENYLEEGPAWFAFASGCSYEFNAPVRPLRRVAPEPSDA